MQYLTADSNVRAGPAAHRTDIISYNPAPYAQSRNNVQGVHPSIRERKHKHLRLGDTPTRGRACQPWKESSQDGNAVDSFNSAPAVWKTMNSVVQTAPSCIYSARRDHPAWQRRQELRCHECGQI